MISSTPASSPADGNDPSADASPAAPAFVPALAAASARRGARRRGVWIVLGLVIAAASLWLADRWMRPPRGSQAHVDVAARDEPHPARPGSITDALTRPPAAGQHPLDPALEVARAGLEHFRGHIRDYKAVFIKQERIGQRLAPEEQAVIKIRQRSDEPAVPFSVYLRFTRPRKLAGREVIYVEGRNDGRLIAHEGGLLGIATVSLLPTSPWAMNGNRHPITEIGLENLILKMIDKGARDRQFGNCQLKVDRQITVNGHAGTEIQIIHPEPDVNLEFHIAKILIDAELNVPIAYESYGWPEQPGEPPPLLERYQYAQLQLNVGLRDEDFDPANEEYRFRWVSGD
jgi:hypothetical protein